MCPNADFEHRNTMTCVSTKPAVTAAIEATISSRRL